MEINSTLYIASSYILIRAVTAEKSKSSTRKVWRPPKSPKISSENLSKARQRIAKNLKPKRASDRLFRLGQKGNPDNWKGIKTPRRQGHELSQDQIDNAIRPLK